MQTKEVKPERAFLIYVDEEKVRIHQRIVLCQKKAEPATRENTFETMGYKADK